MLRALNHNTPYVPHLISYIISYFQAKLPTKTLTLDMMDEIFVLADREDAPGGVAAGIHGTMGDTGDMGGNTGDTGYMEILGKRLNLIAHLTILYKLIAQSPNTIPFISSFLPSLASFLPSFFLRCYWG